MSEYFQTLAQAEQHIQKKKREQSKIGLCIINCTIGFLVVSEAQAYYSFPELFQDSQDHP
jgi:hypothetical protein